MGVFHLDWKTDVQKQLEVALSPAGRWLVCVSGGGDSVALLRLLVGWGYGKRLVVGHFNHHWSEWGDEAQAFVEALAKKHKLEVVVGGGKGRSPTNSEAVARTERREWFLQMCKDRGFNGMILAHTRTDRVESFLMRAGKGSGVHGLVGMVSGKAQLGVLGKRTVRPLLNVGRAELRAYLEEHKQAWLEDPDNESGGSQRAKIRKLLPALAEAGVGEEAITASLTALERANDALNHMVGEFWREHVNDKFGLSVDRVALLAEPLEIQARVLERVLRLGGGDGEGLAPRTSKRLDLLGRIREKEKGTSTLGTVKFMWEEASVRAEKLG